jgi:transcription antitermination factor NusG
MLTTDGNFNWFALFVRTKYERTVDKTLNDKGYETYVPCCAVRRKWADRIKTAQVPLFPNYVFCRFDPAHRFPIVSTPEVYSVVGAGKTPTPIPDEEIAAIRRVVLSGTGIIASSTFEPGEPVVVVSGPLRGLQGTVVRVRNEWRLVVMVSLLQRGVATEISRDDVKSVRDCKGTLPRIGSTIVYLDAADAREVSIVG